MHSASPSVNLPGNDNDVLINYSIKIFTMGGYIGWRSSVRQAISALEAKIVTKEKALKEMARRKAAVGDGLLKALIGVNLLCVIGLWVFKESLSWTSIAKVLGGASSLGVLLLVLRRAVLQYYERRIARQKLLLGRLKDTQRKNIENLKNQIKYSETQEIIEKYEKRREPKDEKEPTVVEKIVTNLI